MNFFEDSNHFKKPKKVVIVGAGTAGLISATMIKSHWENDVDVTVYFDGSKKSIGVGESTTPLIQYLVSLLEENPYDFIRNSKCTFKLGIDFKEWNVGKKYFHGFAIKNNLRIEKGWSSSTFSILNDCFDGGILHNEATTSLPNGNLDYAYAYHIDTKEFCDYLESKLQGRVKFVDDIVKEVNSDGKNIQSTVFEKTGLVEADYFIDATGFNAVLFKHLKPKWNDIKEWLPLDRAIPQQVKYNFQEMPSYTVAEATKNGWIWQIPIIDRYGTGYLYSSQFTSDDEAREDYDKWLNDKFGIRLETDRIIKYNPGYYDDYWIGNCVAVGLSSGFVEPLESTGVHLILRQMNDFTYFNTNFNDSDFSRKTANRKNRNLYEIIINFIGLHYCTNRTDSKFWNYMTNNKMDWVIDFENHCKNDFIDINCFGSNEDFSFWSLDSYIQVAFGLGLMNKNSIHGYLKNKRNRNEIIKCCHDQFVYHQQIRSQHQNLSHKEIVRNPIKIPGNSRLLY